MALNNLFDMVKADKYTADGREELLKAQKAETEDQIYNIGDISRKTGLMKTANGWVKPPKGKQAGAKNAETNYGKVEKKDGKWGVQQKLGKGSQFIEHKDKKDATEALKNYTEGYNTTARSKQDPHSDEARQVKQWNKETEKIKKENRAERRAEHAAQFQKKESKPATENKVTVRQGSKTKTLNETPAEHIKKNWDYYGGRNSQGDMEELVLEPSGYKETDSYSVMGGGKRVQYSKEGAENIVLFYDENGELNDYEIEAAPKAQTRTAGSVSARRMMKDLDGNFWTRPEDFIEDITSCGWDVEEMTNEYAVISNEAGSQYEVRFNDHSDDGDLTMKTYKALQIDEDDDDDSLEDAAPKIRQLTGDTRIRVRK